MRWLGGIAFTGAHVGIVMMELPQIYYCMDECRLIPLDQGNYKQTIHLTLPCQAITP